jgi:hypothetical protein
VKRLHSCSGGKGFGYGVNWLVGGCGDRLSGLTEAIDQRIPDKQTLIDEIAAWQANHNKAHVKANWRFTIKEARVKAAPALPCSMTDSGH